MEEFVKGVLANPQRTQHCVEVEGAKLQEFLAELINQYGRGLPEIKMHYWGTERDLWHLEFALWNYNGSEIQQA